MNNKIDTIVMLHQIVLSYGFAQRKNSEKISFYVTLSQTLNFAPGVTSELPPPSVSEAVNSGRHSRMCCVHYLKKFGEFGSPNEKLL